MAAKINALNSGLSLGVLISLLFIYSERIAALGVREQSYRRLLEGLVALLIGGGRFDLRENIRRLALLYHASVKIGIDPKDLFRDAASYERNSVAAEIVDFLDRTPEEGSLKAMGYKEGQAEDGFTYESNLFVARTRVW